MKIGVDFDDVLFDCNASLALFHNSRYGTSYERKDVWSWYLDQVWGCTEKEAIERVKEWYDSEEHTQSMPISGAIEAIEKLAQSYELHIITSRPSSIRKPTRLWLERYFAKHFAEIHFTNHSEPGSGSKAEICRNLDVSFLIEDSLKHARDVASGGTTVLLLDSPWNQEDVSGNIIRVHSWEEVVELIDSEFTEMR